MKNQLLGISISFIFLVSSIGQSFAENSEINLDNTFYEKSDIISIWGNVESNSQNIVFVSIKDDNGNVVWTERLSLDDNGKFSTLVIAGISDWASSGNYQVILESGQVIKTKSFFYDAGPQVNPPSVVDEYYISQEDLILMFTIASITVVGIFVYLARSIFLRKKTKYDQIEFDSQKDRDYEKYHSEWTDEDIFSSRKSTINAKEFREMYNDKSLPNYYSILNISSNASSLEIKNQYRKLAKQFHPDRNKNSSEEKMAEINQAYEVLSDEKLKEEYDKFFKLR